MMLFFRYIFRTVKLNKGMAKLSMLKHIIIYKEWKNQQLNNSYPIDLALPWITIAAKNYLISFFELRNKGDIRVFEFGSGGSSLFFLKYANEVVSVEHDKDWFQNVSSKVNATLIKKWTGIYIPPEENIIEGYSSLFNPSDPRLYQSGDENFKKYSFKKYASYIDSYPDNYFDVVLVDGRSRPSCMLHAFKKVKKNGLLILDNSEVDYYLNSINIQDNYKLEMNIFGALICSNRFTKTNIYRRIEL